MEQSLEQSSDQQQATRHEVVFIDTTVNGYEQLVDGLLDNADDNRQLELVLLDSSRSGAEQITEALARYDELDAIHIVSHGNDNAVQLGDTWITGDNLDEFSTVFSEWGQSLAQDADLLLYGCDLASSAEGRALVDSLSDLTGADVAASSDLTGNDSYGGDWELEYETGLIDTSVAFDSQSVTAFAGVLAGAPVPTVTVNAPTEEMINESFQFDITLDNTSGSPTDVGYAPFIDLSVPDGIDINGATYLGAAVNMINAGMFDGTGTLVDGGGSPANHPLTGLPVTGGNPGETLYVFELPFGSFVPAQTPATITIDAATDKADGAVVGVPLTMTATGGFALGCDPLDNPGTDPAITGAADTHSITPQVIDLIKDTTAPEDERSTGPNFPFDYTLTINIADGETVTALDITDALPNSFVYVSGSVVVDSSAAGAASGLSITEEPTAGAPQNPPNNDFLIEFGSVTGSAADNDIVVTYTVYIDELDANLNPVLDPLSGDDVNATNDAEVTGTYETGTVGDNDALTDELLEQQSISIQKGVAIVNDLGGAGATPGDTLEYTLNIQVSDFFEFSNVVLDDTFSDGQTWDTSFAPTFSIDEAGTNTSGNFNPANFTVTHNSPGDGTTDVHFDVFAEVPDGVLTGDEFGDGTIDFQPTTVQVRFRTVILEEFTEPTFQPSGDASVDTGDILTNNVTVTGTLPSGQTESDGSGTSVEIQGPSISKSIYAIDGDTGLAGEDIVAGHTITYRLTFAMATADYEDLVLTDFLPLPIFDATEITVLSNSPTATPPPAGTATYGALHDLHTVVPATDPPAMTTDGSSNSVVFDFGTFDVEPSAPATVDLLFTVTAQDVLMADNLFLTNQANATYNSTNNGTVSSDAIVQNQVASPDLFLTKGIVATTAVSPTFDPSTVGPVAFAAPGIGGPAFAGGINSTNLAANPIDSNLRDADAGDLVKFAIVIENTGGADGFDVNITDSIPAEYIVPGSGLNLEVRDGDGNAIGFTGAPADLFTTGIELNDPGALTGAINNFDDATTAGDGSNIIVLTYDLELAVAVTPDTIYTNTGLIDEYGAVEGGNDHTAGSSSAQWTDDATVETLNFVPTKTLISTSEAHTSGSDVAIGEIVRYQLAVEIPEGTMDNLQFDDNLPNHLQFIDDGTATVAFVSTSGITSNDVAGALNLAVAAGANVVGSAPVTPTFVLADDNVGSTSSTSSDPDSYGSGTDPRFKFGQIINNDNDADSEFIVVEFNALVLNTSSQGDGDTRTNNFDVTVDGTVEATSNNVTVTVEEPAIVNVNKTVSPTSGDAGDVVTYTVTFSNTGSTNAFDVNMTDTLPADLALDLVSVNVVLAGGATGSADNSAGNTVDIQIDDIPVGGSVTVTYDATLLISVQPGEVLQNTAPVTYTGLPGSNGTTSNPTGSSNTGAAGADDGERDGSGGHNDYSDSDSADVTVFSPTIAKSLIGTSIVNANNANDEAVIGETIQYQVVVTIPEGTTNIAEIVDTLDSGISFVSLDSITTSAGVTTDNGAINLNDPATIPTNVAGQDVTFSFGNLTNSNNDATPETITIRYTVLVDNEVGNQGEGVGTMLNNSAVFGWTENGTPTATAPDSAAEVEVIEPDLDVTKGVSSPTVDAGDSVTYTINIGHNANSDTDAFDVTFSDPVPANISWSFPADITATHSVLGDISALFQQTGNTLETIPGSSFDLLIGETVTITITGIVSGAVTPGQQLTNTATADWSSLDGNDPNERDGTDGEGGALDDYEESSSATVTAVANPTIAKELISTSINNPNNDDTEVVIGETAQYRVTLTVPEATIPAAEFVDNLDLGLEFISLDSVTGFSGGVATGDITSTIGAFGTTALFNPTVTGDGFTTAQQLTFDFGTLTNSNTDNVAVETLELIYTVRVTNSAANTSNGAAAGTILDNSVVFNWEDGGGNPFNTAPADAEDIEVIEPELDIQKTISDDTPHLGQTVTYTLTITHTADSDADAQNIVVTDNVPGLMTLNLATINVVGASIVNNNSAGNAIDLELDQLTLGNTITITYDATVTNDPNQIGANLNNTANTTWTSLPDGNTDGTGPERDGDTGSAGEDDYNGTVNETAVITYPQVELTKTLVGSPVPATSGVPGNWEVTYDLEITSTGNDPLTQMSLIEDLATQYGGAFVQIVGSPTIVASTATDDPEINALYDGGTSDAEIFDNSGANTNNLALGESVTVRIVIEVDPDAATAILDAEGDLVNQAEVDGTGEDTGEVAEDDSDDPNDPTDVDPNADNNPDDPNQVRFPIISLTKEVVGSPVVASSGTAGNFDVTYQFVIENDGSTMLENLTLVEDLATHFGGAFVRIVPQAGAPAVITGSTATDDPGINAAYDGTAANSNIFDSSTSLLDVNETVTVQIIVEVDPDNATAIYDNITGDGNGDLENQASTTGDDTETGTTVDDNSDDVNDATNNDDDNDNDPDDPTPLLLPDITLTKTTINSVPASSGTAGNFDITFDLQITNTGNDGLNTLSLLEDLNTQYGGAFVAIVPQAGAPATIVASTATDDPEINAAYDGGISDAQIFDNSGANTNLLETGESVTIRIIVEIDPDDPGAIYTNNNLVNQATTQGTGEDSGLTVDDESDDPNDPTDGDPDADNNPDDPNELRFPVISLEKQVVGTPIPATSGATGNYDVTYEFVISNDGTTPLENLALLEDFATQFGGAFVGIVTAPSITASTATDDPGLNGAYNGTVANSNIFDGSPSLLDVNQTITVLVVVEVDPDSATANYDAISGDGNNDLENQASTTANDPQDPGNPVDDNSDDPTDATDNDDDSDNDPDDPTALLLPTISLEKALIGSPVAASSGTAGNFDITFDLTITNTGNEGLNSLSLMEDLATQYGGAFIAIVPQAGAPASIVASTATDDPEINAAYDGGASDAEIFDNSGANINLLDIGQSVTIRIIVEVDPDAAGAIYVNESLENQATVEGTGDESGVTVDDDSDDPTDVTDSDNDGDNDPDDPNEVRFPVISIEKQIVGSPVPASSGTQDNYDVTYEFVIENDGSTPLENITLLEDFATQFGGAFAGIVTAPSITASTATDDPGLNGGYDGTAANSNIFDGSPSLLDVNQTITVQVVVEVDPDNATAIYDSVSGDGNNDLENQASTSGNDPQDPGNPVDDNSDDPTDGTNTDDDGDNDPDDPTAILFPNITLEKALVGSPVAATSGTAGNLDVTFDLTITNNGNEALNSLSLLEDLNTQYGGAFIAIVPQAGAPATIVASTATDDPEINAAYDGGASDAEIFDNSGANTNLLDIGQSVTIRIIVEVDPDAAGAIYVNGALENQATTEGTGDQSGVVVDDDSDDPTDPTDDDPNGDNDPDDPNLVRFPLISIEKQIVGSPVPASSGTQDNYDVTYEFVIENDGTTPLENITLLEDFATQFGGAFAGIVTAPSITASTATDDPGLNGGYDGTAANSNIFDGSPSLLDVNQTITVQVVVEVDPDNATAIYDSVSGDGNNDLENQASTSGNDPQDPGNPVDDNSDDPTDGTNTDDDGDNDPDDPTAILFPNITLEKALVGSPVAATSGTAGNLDVTFDLTITNNGNEALNSLSLLEDLNTQYGGAFIAIVPQAGAPATIVASTATDDPEINAAYDGGASDAEIFDNSGANTNLLDIGQSVTIRIIVEVDPDAAGAIYVNGALENQATTEGTGDQSGVVVDDDSDDPTDPTDDDPNGDNDPDDPNLVRFPLISIEKQVVGSPVPASSGTQDNYDVTFEFVIENDGTTPLENITLLEDFATQFGGAFVGVVTAPSITASTATDDPGLNGGYDGTAANSNIFDGSPSLLDVNQTITVQVVVEVDPDNATAIYDSVSGDGNNDLENQASTSGNDPQDPGNPVDDNSDDPTDGTNTDDDGDNDPDDPTAILFPNITLEKALVGSPVAASSGTVGHFDITYHLTITNNGNEALNSLSLLEDLSTQYGGAFVQIVPQAGAPATIVASTATDDPEINAAYDGGSSDSQIFDNSGANTNLLEVGQAVTIRIVIEIDPDNPTANIISGGLLNQATVEGTGDQSGTTVDDDSDDGTDPTNNDPNGDNDPDDPNQIRIPNISITKQVVGTPVVASSGTQDNYDVTYEFVIENDGTTPLENITLLEDFATQFGGAFVAIVTPPSITASTATDDPGINGAYDGTAANPNMFDGSPSLLDRNQTITVQVVVEVDPDNATAIYDSVSGDGNGDLENQASTSGNDPQDPGNPVDDNSDSPTDPSNNDDDGDNDPDDPTGLFIPNITLEKTGVGSPVAASNGAVGNFDITYDFTITNNGNESLNSLSLMEDLATQYGAAFVQIVPQAGSPATIVASTATDNPEINAAYDGGTSDAEIFDNSGANTNLLEVGQSVTIRVIIEVDPDAVGAIYTNGNLVNQATTEGTGDDSGTVVTDDSDDPTDATDDDPNSDSDPDDPNEIRIPNISLEKEITNTVVAASGIQGNFDVTFQFTISNDGATPLENLTLIEDMTAHYGGAFVGIVSAPVITASTATDDPGINPGYDGDTVTNLFDGSPSLLDVNETITIEIVFEVDPNNVTAIFDSVSGDGNDNLENQASTSGDDPATGETVDDNSDDPADPTNSSDDPDNDPDDPTAFDVPSIGLAKQVVDVEQNGAMFDLTIHFVIENTGSLDVIDIGLFDDFATEFAPHYGNVAVAPAIIASTATIDPNLNPGFVADTTQNMFDGSSGQLEPGQSITVAVVVTLDPDFTQLNNGELIVENQATTEGLPVDDGGTPVQPPVTDDSDSGSDAETTNPSEPGDTGGEDDPTLTEISVFAFDSFNNFANQERIPRREIIDRTLPAFPIDTLYSGITEPGTTLRFKIYNEDGNQVGERTVVADAAGNWVANFPGTIIYKQPHRMEVDQTPPAYNQLEDSGFNLRRYFHPAVHHSLFFSERLTVQSVMRSQPDFVLNTMHAANTNPLEFGWKSHTYELLTSSTNASYQ